MGKVVAMLETHGRTLLHHDCLRDVSFLCECRASIVIQYLIVTISGNLIFFLTTHLEDIIFGNGCGEQAFRNFNFRKVMMFCPSGYS